MTLRTVHLYDELKDKFGGPYRLDIDTPGEAVRALSANFKDFMPTIRDGEWSLVMGEDIETGDSLDETMVGYSLGNSDLHIMPGVAGRKNSKGIIGLVLGVTLLAVGIGGAFLAADAAGAGLGAGFGAYAVGSAGFGITWAGIALMGASMLLSGISSLMTSAPKAPKTGPETASYLLNGPEQNTTQGVAMPLIYGRFRVGSSVVPTRLSATQIAVGSLNFKTQTLGSKGRTIPPATPPNVALPGMLPPDVPDITGALAWQYPYPYYD